MSARIKMKDNKTNNRNLVKCLNRDEKISGSSLLSYFPVKKDVCFFLASKTIKCSSLTLLDVTLLEDKVSPFLPSVHPKLRDRGVR